VNSLILIDSEFDSKVFRIEDQKKLKHLKEILKVEIGDYLEVTWLNRKRGRAEVVNLTPMTLKWFSNEKVQGKANIHLLIGLSRPPTCKKILEHGASLGVKSFTFFPTDLSEKSYGQSKLWRDENYIEFLTLGLSQSRHYFELPSVEVRRAPLEFCSLERTFYLDPSCDYYFRGDDFGQEGQITCLLGPERGWSPRELSLLDESKMEGRCLSSSVLRVEIATFSLLGQLHLLHNSRF